MSKTSASGGMGLPGFLTLLFVALKLLGKQVETPVATWSWWWVLSPLWITAIVTIIAVVLILFFAALADALGVKKGRS